MVAVGAVRSHLGGIRFQSPLRGKQAGQGLQLTYDGPHALESCLGCLGRHSRDGFAHVAHFLAGQHVLIADWKTKAAMFEEVVATDHRPDTGNLQRRGAIEV